MKIVVSDPEEGETYQKEIEDEQAKALDRKRIDQKVQGSLTDLDGYTLQITGGSDKQGFPMRKGLNTAERKKVLLSKGTGYNPERDGTRRRKTVRGEIVSEEIEQLNLKVTKKGGKPLKVLFGLEEPEEEEDEEETEETEDKEEDTEEEKEEEEETEAKEEDKNEEEDEEEEETEDEEE